MCVFTQIKNQSDIDFDPETCQIRVKGKNVEENPHVKMGAWHTLELALNVRSPTQQLHFALD
jgi:stalled ribosome rescue protein Dom34